MIEDQRLDYDTAQREAVAIKQTAQSLAIEGNSPLDSDVYDLASRIIDNAEVMMHVDRAVYIDVQNKLFEIAELCGVDLGKKIVKLLKDADGQLAQTVSQTIIDRTQVSSILDSIVDQMMFSIREEKFEEENKLKSLLGEYLHLVYDLLRNQKS